ncbi:hypothetical protein ABXS75_08295 [Roseburia hominis]
MKMHKLRGRAGESIVEVMVSIVIFLLLVAVLNGAIMFSNSAQRKSQQIRKDTVKICEGLQSASAEGDGTADYAFYASSADGTVVGNQVFTIFAPKQKKKVVYVGAGGDESTVTFYLFGTDGGSTP